MLGRLCAAPAELIRWRPAESINMSRPPQERHVISTSWPIRTPIVTRKGQKLIAVYCMPRSYTRANWIKAQHRAVGSDWRYQNRVNQSRQRTTMDRLSIFLAGGLRRIFCLSFKPKPRDRLHPEPGKPSSTKILSTRVCGVFKAPRYAVRSAICLPAGGVMLGRSHAAPRGA